MNVKLYSLFGVDMRYLVPLMCLENDVLLFLKG